MALNLSVARGIADAALAHSNRRAFAPLTVAVLTADGSVVFVQMEDDCAPLRYGIAVGKARSALALRVGTRELARRFDRSPSFFGAVSSMGEPALLPSPGGVLIRDDTTAVLGAVGVSGDTGDHDEECACYGIRRLGLVADGG